MNNQADKKRNVKSNGAPAANKAVRNQGKAPAEKTGSVPATGRDSREDRRSETNTPSNTTTITTFTTIIPSQLLNSSGVYGNARFVQAIAALVGHVVQVRVRGDEDVYEGVLYTISPTFEVALNTVHVMDPSVCDAEVPQAPDHLAGLLKNIERIRKPEKDGQPLRDTMIFNIMNIVSLTAYNIDLEYVTKEHAFTDSQISRSNGRVQARDLEKWMDDIEGPGEALEDDSLSCGTTWTAEEMFKKNKDKFGVKSTYNDNLQGYTFQIQERNDDDFRQKEAQAARIASEIEANPQHKRNHELENGGEEEDEEAKYSAVVTDRPSQQQPQQQQQQQQQQVDRPDSRYAHSHRRRTMQQGMNGGAKGQQRGTQGGSHHNQRNSHARASPPIATPAPQQGPQTSHQNPQTASQQQGSRKESSNLDKESGHQQPSAQPQSASQASQHRQQQQSQQQPAAGQHDNTHRQKFADKSRKSPSPKLDASGANNRRDTPATQAAETARNARSPTIPKDAPKAKSPPAAAVPGCPAAERSASPKTPSPALSPATADQKSGPSEDREEIVKNSTLNPNAKEFVFTPKPLAVPHNSKPSTPQLPLTTPTMPHAMIPPRPGTGHMGIGLTPSSIQHAQGQGLIMSQFPFQHPVNHQHPHQGGGGHQNRQFQRGGKGNNRQVDQTMHVTGSPIVTASSQQPQLLLSYQGPPATYGPPPPNGVPPNVVMQPQLGQVPTQPLQMVPYNIVQAPRGTVMSPPGGPAGLFSPVQLAYGDVHLGAQPHQMILREGFTGQLYPGQFDTNLFVVSQPAQTPSQSGAPTPPTANSGPHGHPAQHLGSYLGQSTWSGQPLLMMGTVGANGAPTGTPPPPHHGVNIIIPPPALGQHGVAGHGATHGHAHFGQAVTVPNTPGALQVQTVGGGLAPLQVNPNANQGLPQSQPTPTGQTPIANQIMVGPPQSNSGQQTGPQQPPPQQTQQNQGRNSVGNRS